MSSKRQLLPYLLSIGVLLSEVGCPKCAYPVQVEVYTYPCEYAPCDAQHTYDVSLEYSFEGGPFLPCESGGSCGDDSGSCNADTNGTYRIVARSGADSAEVTTVVEEYSCITGGAKVELTLGGVKCAPLGATVEPVGGTVDWEVGETAANISFPAGPSGLSVTSSAEVVPGVNNEVTSGDVVTVSLAGSDERWQLSFELGDLRALGVGQYDVKAVSGDLFGVCAAMSRCTTEGDVEGATLIVEEAEGGALPWPDIVSEGFVRRYRLIYETDHVVDSAVTADCEDCVAAGAIAVDLNFVRTENDYGLSDEGDCLID